MLLCLDVGNSHITAGVYDGENFRFSFRYTTQIVSTSDQFGVFLRNVARENEIDPKVINAIAICSVVPSIDYPLSSACNKYFNIDPFFLRFDSSSSIKLKNKTPATVGADRIANAVAGIHQFPGKNLVIVDLGTAITYCAISKEAEFLGGAITAGLRTSMEALSSMAAKLAPVNIKPMKNVLGTDTVSNIQAGLYYGHLGAVREITTRLANEVFPDDPPLIIGTGGFSHLFKNENVFSHTVPHLTLNGLRIAYQLNAANA